MFPISCRLHLLTQVFSFLSNTKMKIELKKTTTNGAVWMIMVTGGSERNKDRIIKLAKIQADDHRHGKRN